MENPNLRELDSEVREQDGRGTLPLVLPGIDLPLLNLILVEVRNAVDNQPWHTSSKVEEFMNDKDHKTCRQNRKLARRKKRKV